MNSLQLNETLNRQERAGLRRHGYVNGRCTHSILPVLSVGLLAKLRQTAPELEKTPPVSRAAAAGRPIQQFLEPEEASHRPLGRALSSRQFWDLMERWDVPDALALELIEYPGKLGSSGKRPRFRFTTRQLRITSYLAEIDTALAVGGKDTAWVHRKIRAAPFERRAPIEHMVAHRMDGMAQVLRVLNRAAMQAALGKRTPSANNKDEP